MGNETIRIFDEQGNGLGVASRDEVHQVGHWHETFHCWFISQGDEHTHIYFQIRSESKKDFPNLLDITAAGHILAHEKVSDGIREVKEELGIDLSYTELESLGVIPNSIIREDFIDNEFSHVFLYKNKKSMDVFQLQREEVWGLVKANFNDFYELWLGEKNEIQVEGFKLDHHGHKSPLNMSVGKEHFVPHHEAYFSTILKLISDQLSFKLKTT